MTARVWLISHLRSSRTLGAWVLVFASLLFSSQLALGQPNPPSAKACGMQLGGAPAFCDTFDTAAGIGNRSGQLNGTIWGVSRWTGDMNFGSGSAFP